MRYRKLGNTGLIVSEMCLGAMTFGTGEGMWATVGSVTQDGVTELIKTAFDRGINFIDTADFYSAGRSEELTGHSLKKLGLARDSYVLATKVLLRMGPGHNQIGLSRYHIMDGVKASLARLQLDHIDLYQIHAFDPATPIEEAVRAMDDLVRQGHVRYVGVSNWAAWQIMKALGISERLGLARFESLQAYYTIASRDLERELVPMLQSEQLGLMVWSPLAGGLLTGKYRSGIPDDSRAAMKGMAAYQQAFVHPERNAAVGRLEGLAAELGCSVTQLAIAWAAKNRRVSSVILGASGLGQLQHNLGALDVQARLTKEVLARIDEIALPLAD